MLASRVKLQVNSWRLLVCTCPFQKDLFIIYICTYIYISLSLSFCLPVSLSLCLSVSLSLCLYIYIYISLSLSLSRSLSLSLVRQLHTCIRTRRACVTNVLYNRDSHFQTINMCVIVLSFMIYLLGFLAPLNIILSPFPATYPPGPYVSPLSHPYSYFK